MKNTVKVLAIIALVAVFGLAFPACNPDPTHTHEWKWVETTAPTLTADGLETETCTICGATSGNTRPIAKLEQPHEQTPVTINLTFGTYSYTATVKGTLTDTQWNGVATKIETAINNAYTNVPAGVLGFQQQNIINGAFVDNNVVIIVEKTTEYSIYKVVAGNKTTLYVNIDGLDNLQSNVVKAATAMGNGEASIDGVTPPPCTTCLTTYGTTAHLGIDANGNVVACTCGGTNCSNCTEQFAYLDDNNTIKIRKENGITVQQMNTAVANINTGYGYLSDVEKGTMAGKITEIHITTGNIVNHVGTILNVCFEADDEAIAEYIVLME
ncbi:MAG: hypothetical protein FWF55_00400 [Treponema sp.]|nr:hypothetical protein [Treponema sp.]